MNKFRKLVVIEVITILFIFILPYFLFEGKLFIGGDDTRLQYLYPEVYLNSIVPFSWNRFASLGWSIAHQFYLPFLVIWAVLKSVLRNDIVLGYLAFSTPLAIGFIYFQKFLGALIDAKENRYQVYSGALFFIFSPIIVYDQLFVFLTPVWLLALIPITLYYFLLFLQTSKFVNIYKALIAATVFSLVSLSVPWILGFFLPLFVASGVLILFFSRKQILIGIKKFIIFFGILFLSQSFWLLGYIMSYVQVSSNSFAAKVFSKGFQDTFTPTILSSATGDILNPLLNLFHRQIAFDFEWDLRNIFLNFYDKTLLFDGIFVLILFLGLLSFKKYGSKNERKTYLYFLTAFLLSLYFFTVNIGPLKETFLLLGKLPLFTMFRNFADKFSVGYVIIYTVVITFSLIFAKRKFSDSKYIPGILTAAFVGVIILNVIPIKGIVNAPLWRTENVHKTMNIPEEYLQFTSEIRKDITPNNIILSLPFGASSYTVIKDEKTNNVFLGTSPVVIFSGVSDMSGYLSFNFTNEANIVDQLILQRKYSEFNKILYNHNVNFVALTKNIPDEVKGSYAFNKDVLEAQDKHFLNAIVDKKIYTSKNGNYELYTTKKRNSILKTSGLHFQRVNPAKFRLYIRNLNKQQNLSFLESFHSGWQVYLTKNPSLDFCNPRVIYPDYNTVECSDDFKIYDNDLRFLSSKPIFNDTHDVENNFSNKWTVDPNFIKNNYDSSYFTANKDGSINIEMDLYFKPQIYFYLGLGITILVFLFSTMYLIFENKNEKNKK